MILLPFSGCYCDWTVAGFIRIRVMDYEGLEREHRKKAGVGMAKQEARNFDLNMETILEGWEIRHAIRQVWMGCLRPSTISSPAGRSRILHTHILPDHSPETAERLMPRCLPLV